MSTTTLVVGIVLVFLLFTKPGRIMGLVLLGVALVAVAALYIYPTLPAGFGEAAGKLFLFIFMGTMFVSGFVQLKAWGEGVKRERRERATRLSELRLKAIEREEARVKAEQANRPLDGEILLPQLYLSP